MAPKRPTPRRKAPRSRPVRAARSTGGSPAAAGELESENQRLVRALGERVKELRALHQTAELFRRAEFSTGELLARVAALLPPAFQHPEVAAAAVEFCGLGRATPGFREGAEELQAAFVTSDGRTGRIRVMYLESRPGPAAGPFLEEERSLLETLAEMLRGYFEQRASAEAREAAHQRQERQHDALARLTRSPAWHRADAAVLHEITESVAAALAVARVSYWRRAEDGSQLECEDLFEAAAARHTRGAVLRAADYPAYFAALATQEVIDAADARRDPRTREFTAGYLEPLDIQAMLDTPVRVNGRLVGVLCLEHTGGRRRWTADERSFAVTAASLWSLALAQSALARSEGRLRTILESEPECVKLVSPRGELLDMNPAGLRMIEAERLADVTGRPVLNLIHPDDRPAFGELHRRVCQGGTGQLQFRLVGLRGTERWMETHSTPLREPDGGIRAVLSVTRDITERRRAEQRTLEAWQFNQRLIEHSPLAIVTYRPTGEGVSANAASARLLGAPDVAAVAARNFRQLPLWRESGLLAAAEAALADGQPREQEVRGVNSFGRDTWLHCRLVPFDFGGERYLLGFFDDIRERKQAEEALRVSEERFREMAENIGDIFYSYDPANNQLLYANQAYERIWGRPLERVFADPTAYLEDIHPEDRPAAEQAFARQLAGEVTDVTFRVIRPEGDVRWVHEHGVPVLDEQGRVTRIVGTMSDITDNRRNQEKLREQAELLDKAQDAILVRDLEHRIQYWNKSAERLYGWPAAEAVGRSVKDLLYQDPGAFEAATAATLEKGEWVGELMQFNQAGRPLTVEGRWTLVRDGQGRPKSILAINTDVSERKRIEQQLLRTQRMESIGTLAGGIAHDLNNVLAPILVSIELLRLDEQDPERLTVLASIEDSARRGADLVRQVLSFARGIEGERVLTNLQHLARELRQIIRDTFPKNIEFRLEAADDLWLLAADPTQMHQVMMNLCVNARDAMPEGGRLTLGLRNFEVDDIFAGMNPDARPGPYVVIKVEDTGTGIPANIQERIFDPFFTTKEFGKGTGLGLATVLTIVKSHGGFINLYSEPGKGTKFKVYLPAGATPESAVPAAADQLPRLPHGRGELVLVVDDEEAVRTVTQRTLERFGYRVLPAIHGADAVALYAQHGGEIAVVLTDMAMPVMDGPATILALRAMNPAVKIIGSSGHASGGGVAKAIGAGVHHFVPKPYTAETLLKVLADVLARPD